MGLAVFAAQLLCVYFYCIPPNSPVKIPAERIPRNSTPQNSPLDSVTLNPDPVVQTRSGEVQGYLLFTIRGRTFAGFEGIPYAKPPTGRRRFANPEPAEAWKGIRKAHRQSPACVQLDFTRNFRVLGREDCLYLNVYTPFISSDNPANKISLPVIVFIFGGGYLGGSGSDYGAAYLQDNDVVLVIMNYRLGIMGFLSTGDKVASGNWGLKDQLLALQWVQQNIQNFGGNPNLVTLMGESAGAAAVGLHIVSPSSRGLFHRAILQSGSAFSYWAINNSTYTNSNKMANYSSCPSSNSQQMVSCLRGINANALVAQTLRLFPYYLPFTAPFGAVLESELSTQPFLTQPPEVTYSKGGAARVPMIIGFNQDEGGLFGALAYLTPGFLRTLNRGYNEIMPRLMGFENKTNGVDALVADKIGRFYHNSSSMTFWNRRDWMRMFGDRMILEGTYVGMQYHCVVAPTYGYMFGYKDTISRVNVVGLDSKDWGVSHGDDLHLFFNSSLLWAPLELGKENFDMAELIHNLWTNFAKFGKPWYEDEKGKLVEEWREIRNPGDFEILKLNKTSEMMRMPFLDRLNFWKGLGLTGGFFLV